MKELYSGKTYPKKLYSGKTVYGDSDMPTLTIRKSGNAQIVSLPKNFLQQLGVGTGDLLNAKLEGGYIVLTPKPAENQELQMRLEKMFEGVTPETYRTDEDIEWMNMPSVGREILP